MLMLVSRQCLVKASRIHRYKKTFAVFLYLCVPRLSAVFEHIAFANIAYRIQLFSFVIHKALPSDRYKVTVAAVTTTTGALVPPLPSALVWNTDGFTTELNCTLTLHCSQHFHLAFCLSCKGEKKLGFWRDTGTHQRAWSLFTCNDNLENRTEHHLQTFATVLPFFYAILL